MARSRSYPSRRRGAPRTGASGDAAPERGAGCSWWCPTPASRARLLEMGARVRPVRTLGSALLGVVLLVSAGELGWWMLVAYAPPAVFLWLIDLRIARSRRPEHLIVVASVWSSLTIGAVAAITGGASSPVLVWLAIPSLLLATRFRLSVVVLGGVFAVLVALGAAGVATLAPPTPPAPTWVWLLCFVALLVNVVGVSAAMLSAELTSRADAAIDALTGLGNRHALNQRFTDLESTAVTTGQAVEVLLVDVDHFKTVNDTHGHDVGDQVLAAIATTLREQAYHEHDVYRLGGEEFLVVHAGDGEPGAELGERLRAAVAAQRPIGLAVTVSIGCAGAAGAGVDRTDLLRRADRALYAAKAGGRNQVTTAPAPTAGTAALSHR